METKKAIRDRVIGLRDSLSAEEVRQKSLAVTETVVSLPAYRRSREILIYADYRNEVSTRYLIERAWHDGRKISLPVCRGKEMRFYRLRDFSELRKGAFGIPEPGDTEPAGNEDTLVIMPGVAFDRELHRIGYGGGYYDRYLKEHPGIYSIALAFELQVLEKVPFLPHDIRPHILVTERTTYERISE